MCKGWVKCSRGSISPLGSMKVLLLTQPCLNLSYAHFALLLSTLSLYRKIIHFLTIDMKCFTHCHLYCLQGQYSRRKASQIYLHNVFILRCDSFCCHRNSNLNLIHLACLIHIVVCSTENSNSSHVNNLCLHNLLWELFWRWWCYYNAACHKQSVKYFKYYCHLSTAV